MKISTSTAALDDQNFRFPNQSFHITKFTNKQLSIPGFPCMPVKQMTFVIAMTDDCHQNTVTVTVVVTVQDESLNLSHHLQDELKFRRKGKRNAFMCTRMTYHSNAKHAPLRFKQPVPCYRLPFTRLTGRQSCEYPFQCYACYHHF